MKLSYTPFQITKNFHTREFDCKDGTQVPAKYLLNVIYVAVQLQRIKDYLGVKKLIIGSGYRTDLHNKVVGGQPTSNHLTANAVDLYQDEYRPKKFYVLIKDMIDKGLLPDGELIEYPSFVHYAPKYSSNHYPRQFSNLYTYEIKVKI